MANEIRVWEPFDQIKIIPRIYVTESIVLQLSRCVTKCEYFSNGMILCFSLNFPSVSLVTCPFLLTPQTFRCSSFFFLSAEVWFEYIPAPLTFWARNKIPSMRRIALRSVFHIYNFGFTSPDLSLFQFHYNAEYFIYVVRFQYDGGVMSWLGPRSQFPCTPFDLGSRQQFTKYNLVDAMPCICATTTNIIQPFRFQAAGRPCFFNLMNNTFTKKNIFRNSIYFISSWYLRFCAGTLSCGIVLVVACSYAAITIRSVVRRVYGLCIRHTTHTAHNIHL